MAKFDLKMFARRGAAARLEELTQEIRAILAAFPDLTRGRTRQAATQSSSTDRPRRRRKSMSAAQRKAVSERMRKYWAGRRAATAGKKR